MYDNLEIYSMDELVQRIKELPNDRGYKLDTRLSGDKMQCVHLGPEEMEDWNKDDSRFNIVYPLFRKELMHFGPYLEHTHFAPHNVALNNTFWQAYYTWEDVQWDILSIPATKANLAYDAAANTNTRISDGVPRIVGGTAGKKVDIIGGIPMLTFPLNRDNTFSLAPASDRIVAGMFTGPKAPSMEDILEHRKQQNAQRRRSHSDN